ncbi:MAG: Holliday junction branch migration protein RuvA [Candidatus Latescibacteria bacterium]|nr:Holliday junction branch migration protein RuvA [Candidatus Latescibacterota bacterium]
MISYLQGTLVWKAPTEVVLDVGGIGYFLHIPLSSYQKIGEVGTSVKILTYLSVKENGLELFGFATAEEKELFESLIAVSGIGPRLAQAILSGISVREFHRAIIQADMGALTAIPGIGKKTAQRLLFELKGRFQVEQEKPSDQSVRKEKSETEEAVLALISLGYRRTAAEEAVAEVVRTQGAEVPLEELVKKALRYI